MQLFSFALWNPHSKQILEIKKSVLKAVDDHIDHFKALQANDI